MKLGEAIYNQQQSGAAGAEAGEKKDDVVDAEFTEVDDDKAARSRPRSSCDKNKTSSMRGARQRARFRTRFFEYSAGIQTGVLSATITKSWASRAPAREVELKGAFRKLAMQHHPDRNPGDSECEHKFKRTQRSLRSAQGRRQACRL